MTESVSADDSPHRHTDRLTAILMWFGYLSVDDGCDRKNPRVFQLRGG